MVHKRYRMQVCAAHRRHEGQWHTDSSHDTPADAIKAAQLCRKNWKRTVRVLDFELDRVLFRLGTMEEAYKLR